MNRAGNKQQNRGALEMVEEGTHLLRSLPLQVFTIYYAGSLPFVLGFLYFWADMSRGAFADRHLTGGALSMALLFIWMKCCQTVFVSHLKSHIRNVPFAPWPLSRIFRMAVMQTAIQSTGFLVLPLSLLLTIPFVSAYALYQNILVFGDAQNGEIRQVYEKALRHSLLRSYY